MEVIKELPEVFEEFAEQRKNSFLAMKQLKDKGIPETKIKRSVKIMKERYEALELNIVKIPVEDTIMMSGIDNNGDVGDWGEEDLGF